VHTWRWPARSLPPHSAQQSGCHMTIEHMNCRKFVTLFTIKVSRTRAGMTTDSLKGSAIADRAVCLPLRWPHGAGGVLASVRGKALQTRRRASSSPLLNSLMRASRCGGSSELSGLLSCIDGCMPNLAMLPLARLTPLGNHKHHNRPDLDGTATANWMCHVWHCGHDQQAARARGFEILHSSQRKVSVRWHKCGNAARHAMCYSASHTSKSH
jgi:hypothetical protein